MIKVLYINLLTQKVELSPQRDSHLMVAVLFEAITELADLKRIYLSKFHNPNHIDSNFLHQCYITKEVFQLGSHSDYSKVLSLPPET